MISIINYGVGNIGSLKNMLDYLDIKSKVVTNLNSLKDSNKMILPGVGAFDTAINKLKKNHMIDILNELVVYKKVPILGICLGMHLLLDGSEEGSKKGLGFLGGKAIRFPDETKIKIPHMGWNNLELVKRSVLTSSLNFNSRFYFIHSYYVKLKDKKNCISLTNYSIDFTSAFEFENIFGVQFHPEKSHKFGMEIFKNFEKV